MRTYLKGNQYTPRLFRGATVENTPEIRARTALRQRDMRETRRPLSPRGLDGNLLVAGLGPLDAQAGAEGEGQAGIADGGDVPVAGEVLRLAIDTQPGEQFVACAQVQLGVAEVQIAIGQDQGVPLIHVFVAKKSGVVAATGKRRGEYAGEPFAGIAGRKESGVRRTPEGTSAFQRRIDAHGNAVKGRRISAEQRRIVAGK